MDITSIIVPLFTLSLNFHVWLDRMKIRDRQFRWFQVTKEGLCLTGVESLLHRTRQFAGYPLSDWSWVYCIGPDSLQGTLCFVPLTSFLCVYSGIGRSCRIWRQNLGACVIKHFEMKMLSCVIWVNLISIPSAFDDGDRGRFGTGAECHITVEAGVWVVHSQQSTCMTSHGVPIEPLKRGSRWPCWHF